MKVLYRITVGALLVFGLSLCQRKECQTPPPQYNFAFVTAQQKPVVSDSLQAASLRLVYYSSTGTKIIIPTASFKPYPSDGPATYVYRMGYDVIGQSQPSEYTVEVGGQPVSKLSLTAQKNNSDCDGWMHVTNVRSNQQSIPVNPDNVTYVVKVDV
jgi:hypothetical protein